MLSRAVQDDFDDQSRLQTRRFMHYCESAAHDFKICSKLKH